MTTQQIESIQTAIEAAQDVLQAEMDNLVSDDSGWPQQVQNAYSGLSKAWDTLQKQRAKPTLSDIDVTFPPDWRPH